MELFIAWIVFSLVAGVIASSKGLSAAKFIFVSLILSPLIGILVALGSRPDLEELERRKAASGTSKKCPFCAELIKAEAIVCRFCGRDLVTLPVMPGSKGEADQQVVATKKPLSDVESTPVTIVPAPSTSATEDGEEPKAFGFMGTRAYKVAIGSMAVAVLALLAVRGWLYLSGEHQSEAIPISGSRPVISLTGKADFYRPMNRSVTVSGAVADFGHPDVDESTAEDRPRPPMPVRILSYRQADVKVLFLADAQMNQPPPYKGWIFLGFTDGSSKQALDSAVALRRLELASRR